MKHLAITWLILSFPISLLLWGFIYKQILKKPLLTITVVDWIYLDTILYINSVCFVYSAAIVHALVQPDEQLNFECAIFYSLTISALVTSICVSLIFSGGMRLISMIKNSEVAGLQILGLEHEAIIKVRLMTIIISAVLLMICFGTLGALPGAYFTLRGEEYKSYIETIQDNNFGSLYIVMPALALVVNYVARFYSKKINQQIQKESLVFVIFGHPTNTALLQQDNFLFSLGFVLAIPLLFLFSFLSSFSSRHERLLFIGPVQITFFSLALPIVFILKNKQMKKIIFIRWVDPIVIQIDIMLNILKKLFSPAVTPLA